MITVGTTIEVPGCDLAVNPCAVSTALAYPYSLVKVKHYLSPLGIDHSLDDNILCVAVYLAQL